MFIFKFPFGPLQTNALLIGCPKTKLGAVVDPSLGSAGPILHKAEELGLKLEKILLTHSHWDHFGDAAALKLEVSVHPLDARNLVEPGSDGLPLFVPITPVTPAHFLNEGEIVRVGDLELEVIHTPGHSPGSICFYVRSENVLLAGDTLFQGGIGNLQLPTAQPELMGASLEKLTHLPPATRVVPGHGPDTTIGKEINYLRSIIDASRWKKSPRF